MIKANKIELFKNLSQNDFEDKYYDFHNDFNCIKILFENNILILLFKNIIGDIIVSMKFHNTSIVFFDFEFTKELGSLTIDTLYRGRYESNKELIEFEENENGYFYLEFYEGQKIEFWSAGISIEED